MTFGLILVTKQKKKMPEFEVSSSLGEDEKDDSAFWLPLLSIDGPKGQTIWKRCQHTIQIRRNREESKKRRSRENNRTSSVKTTENSNHKRQKRNSEKENGRLLRLTSVRRPNGIKREMSNETESETTSVEDD